MQQISDNHESGTLTFLMVLPIQWGLYEVEVISGVADLLGN